MRRWEIALIFFAGANLILAVWNPGCSMLTLGLSASACFICLIVIAVGIVRGDLR